MVPTMCRALFQMLCLNPSSLNPLNNPVDRYYYYIYLIDKMRNKAPACRNGPSGERAGWLSSIPESFYSRSIA